jgi:hypothetical protein
MIRSRVLAPTVAGLAVTIMALGSATGAATITDGAVVGESATRLDEAVEIPRAQFVPPRRAIMISDSVLAGVDVYGQTYRLTGTDWFTDYGVCRRLITTSCKAAGSPRPPTLVQELSYLPFVPDRYDLFIVATGYNDSAWVLSTYWDQIVGAVRAAGFEHIAWLDYRTAMGGGVGANSAGLNSVVYARAGDDPKIQVWDFNAATFGQPWFVGDQTHLSPYGAGQVADWLSHQVKTQNVTP